MRRLLLAVLLLLPFTARAAQEVAANEGNAGLTTVQVVIVAATPQPNGLVGQWRTIDGTATLADNDYVFATGDFVIPSGQSSSLPITIAINGDTKVEADETFALELFNYPSGTTLDTGPYPIRIRNDDVASLSVSSPSVTEGNSGTAALAFFVTLAAPAATTVTASYATADITATAPSDYVAASGTLTFAAGETQKVVNVTVNGDTTFESTETMRLTVTASGGTAATGTGTIVNDDTPSLTVSSGQLLEGNSGTTPMIFTVTIAAPAPEAFQVTYATSDGTAKAAEDYQAITGIIGFLAGQTTRSIAVNVIGDTVFEPDETFTLTVTGPNGAPIPVTGTILNDDAAPIATLRIVSGNGQRGRLGAQLAQPLVVEVLDAAGAPVSGTAVSWRVTSGNATLASASTSTNAQGRASNTVTLNSVGAVSVEAAVGARTVVFNLASETLFEERATGPVAKPIARALDTLCARNDSLFAAVCRALSLLDDGALSPALERVAPLQSGAQSKVAGQIFGTISSGIGSRLSARRSGVDRLSVQNLSLSISGQPVPFGSLATAMMQTQAAATPDDDGYNGWSAFVSGHLGDGERRARGGGEIGFDLKSSGLMAGVDKQVGAGVLGAAVHVMKFDADFNAGAGSLDTDGLALSFYGSRGGLWAGKRSDGVHLDGSVTFGRSRFDAEHNAGSGALFGTARSKNDASLFAVTGGGGLDAHRGRTEFDATLSGTWSRADIDDLSEAGSGPLILFVQGHEIESLLANAGLNVRWTFPASFGVIVPSVRGELVHEFRGGARLVTARFLRDPLETGFTVPVDRPDENYGKLSAGLQAVFPRGLSLFVEVTQDVARSDLRFRNVQFNVSKSF